MRKNVLRPLIHTVCPYKDFDSVPYPEDLHGWNSDRPTFKKLIDEVNPHLVIEVGTWKGASAVHMGGLCKEKGLPTEIVCVDTWLGALEFWLNQEDPERYLSLHLQNGYPTVYYQFLANVVRAGLQEMITPFPITSSIAAMWFERKNVQADLIYLDASHELEDFIRDFRSYKNLVRSGGVLFGDDCWWASGIAPALELLKVEGHEFEIEESNFWVWRNPV